MQQLQNVIESAFERRADITPANVDTVTREAVNRVIGLLDSGALRVAEKIDGQWVTHQWLKKAVLLSFRINDNKVMDGAETRYYDKVPMKFADYDEARFQKEGFRVVPPATVRRGAFIARNTVLMPSYVNIGAYVDEGTMVDTGHRRFLRSDRQKRSPVRRRRHRRRAGAAAGQPDHHRRQLLHRRALRSGGRRDRGRRLGDFDGRIPRPEHPHL